MARLLFFGKLVDLAGARLIERSVSVRELPVSGLIDELAADDPVLGAALAELSIRIIVNEEIAARDTLINDGDEVAFLPPVSGG